MQSEGLFQKLKTDLFSFLWHYRETDEFKSLHRKLKEEINLIILSNTFYDEDKQEECYKIARTHYDATPEDRRVWVPLYVLARKVEAKEGFKKILKSLYPRINADQKSLENHKVDIKSITKDYEYFEQEDRNNAKIASERKQRVQALRNWREVIRSGSYQTNMISDLINQAFDNDLEKHIALQCLVLIGGNINELKNWPRRVWREPSQYNYPLNANLRYKTENQEIEKNPLYQLIRMLLPVLGETFPEKRGAHYLSEKLSLPIKEITKVRQPIQEEHPLVANSGLKLYYPSLKKNQITFYSISGLKREIIYIDTDSSINFDEKYFKERPHTHFFHLLMITIQKLNAGQHFLLSLDPLKTILPFLRSCHRIIDESQNNDFKTIFQLKKDPLEKSLRSVDRVKVQRLFKNAKISGPSLIGLWNELNEHFIKIHYAETLDLIGIIEAVTDTDIVKLHPDFMRKISKSHPITKLLLDFSLRLKFS